MRTLFILLISMLSWSTNSLGTQSELPAGEEDPQQQKATNEERVTTIILLRHAEKGENDPKDPSLSEKGQQRAILLARLFKDVPINAFYATPYKRTIGTIGPLAQAQGKEVLLYDPADKNGFAQMIDTNKGKKIIIAGHSNTIPHMVNALIGKNEFSDMAGNDHGKIWILVFRGAELIDHNVLNY